MGDQQQPRKAGATATVDRRSIERVIYGTARARSMRTNGGEWSKKKRGGGGEAQEVLNKGT